MSEFESSSENIFGFSAGTEQQSSRHDKRFATKKLNLSREALGAIKQARADQKSPRDEDREIAEVNQKIIDEAYRKAEARIKRSGIKETDFIMDYGNTAIANDLAYIDKRHSQFETQNNGTLQEYQKLGKIIEAIIDEYSSQWLGENCTMHHTAEFDDIAHGIDSIAEFKTTTDKGGSQFLGLMIDATTGERVGDKFNKLKNDLDRGRMGELKYFKSQNNELGLHNIPKVIVGCGHATTKQLAELWVNNDVEALRNHRVRFLFFRQIIFSLESIADISEKVPYEKTQGNAAVYRKDAQLLKGLFQSLDLDGQMDSALQSDPIWISMQAQINGLKKYYHV